MIDRRAFLSLSAVLPLLPGAASAQQARNVFGFTLDGLDGNPLVLSRFSGKVLLVVNTASKCAFTPQYEGLEALWRRYGGRGLVVIGVPSNDFGRQEPGSASDIKEFCTQTYDVTFPMAAKTVVRGAGAHPLYRAFAQTLGRDGVPGWNFHKVLVGRNGVPVAGFPSRMRPDDSRITLAVEAALAKAPGGT